MAYTTAANVRTAVPALASVTDFPDATLTALIAEFEQVAERYRGVAYEPRTVTGETHRVDTWRPGITLSWPYVRTVTSVTVNATATTSYTIDYTPGIIRSKSAFRDDAAIVVDYTHGFDAPPDGLIRACNQYVRACALADRSGVGRDVIAQTFDGGLTRFSTPDWAAGRPTGYVEVDRLLNTLADYRTGVA